MIRTLGTDIHRHPLRIDWPDVSTQGVRFAIVQATEGATHVDPMFEKHLTDASAEGLLTGSHHVFHTDRDPELQALNYFSVAGPMGTDLPPVLTFATLHGDTAPVNALARALAFLQVTEWLWNRECVVRTSPAFWTLLGDPSAPDFGARPLWIAHGGVDAPRIPRPWTRWSLWQFDVDGRCMALPPGVPAGFNWFDGDEEALRAFCRGRLPAPLAADPEAESDDETRREGRTARSGKGAAR